MKIESIGNFDYQIMVCFHFLEENDIISFIKQFLLSFQKKFKLGGFYKVVVFPRFFGLFFQLLEVKDSYYKNGFDYRITFDTETSFYFRTEDYFVVESCPIIYYYDGVYYGLVDDSFDEILEKVEFGEFVLEKEIDFNQLLLVSK